MQEDRQADLDRPANSTHGAEHVGGDGDVHTRGSELAFSIWVTPTRQLAAYALRRSDWSCQPHVVRSRSLVHRLQGLVAQG